MERARFARMGRLGVASVLCAGALIGSACGRETITSPNAVTGSTAPVTGTGFLAALEGTQTFGLAPSELIDRGWSCRVTPVGTTACSPPGRGLPVFGAPGDRPPSYLVHVFDTATSEYLGFGRMIRTDLYEDQTCPSTGAAYTYLPHIGYYECFNAVS
jgi:hypothetical protein